MIYGKLDLGDQALARAARAFGTNRGIKDTEALAEQKAFSTLIGMNFTRALVRLQ